MTQPAIILVHGFWGGAAHWAKVIPELAKAGHTDLHAVEMPLTSLADDAGRLKKMIAQRQGPVLLVGHSYGGAVITEAGGDAKVAGLVYVAAFSPDVGQSVGSLLAEIPAPALVVDAAPDGFGFVQMETFKDGFAGDTSDADAAFLRDSQVPIALSAFGTPVTQAAWRTKPSWAIVPTQDRAIDPRLLRQMAQKIGADVVEVEASHVPFLTQPRAVADVIDKAARAASAGGGSAQ